MAMMITILNYNVYIANIICIAVIYGVLGGHIMLTKLSINIVPDAMTVIDRERGLATRTAYINFTLLEYFKASGLLPFVDETACKDKDALVRFISNTRRPDACKGFQPDRTPREDDTGALIS